MALPTLFKGKNKIRTKLDLVQNVLRVNIIKHARINTCYLCFSLHKYFRLLKGEYVISLEPENQLKAVEINTR